MYCVISVLSTSSVSAAVEITTSDLYEQSVALSIGPHSQAGQGGASQGMDHESLVLLQFPHDVRSLYL